METKSGEPPVIGVPLNHSTGVAAKGAVPTQPTTCGLGYGGPGLGYGDGKSFQQGPRVQLSGTPVTDD